MTASWWTYFTVPFTKKEIYVEIRQCDIGKGMERKPHNLEVWFKRLHMVISTKLDKPPNVDTLSFFEEG
ncbi:hypothetical protein ACQU0X_02705 [Pseudovibrio ascidiaceicola]|uniref:hypothetical protein n=1 Tax=Pseudovibrio ascidiaceicola TaxID=285279 RepID=UPI003D35FF55